MKRREIRNVIGQQYDQLNNQHWIVIAPKKYIKIRNQQRRRNSCKDENIVGTGKDGYEELFNNRNNVA